MQTVSRSSELHLELQRTNGSFPRGPAVGSILQMEEHCFPEMSSSGPNGSLTLVHVKLRDGGGESSKAEHLLGHCDV